MRFFLKTNSGSHEFVAHALLRTATPLVPSHGEWKRNATKRSHECERGTHECVRHIRQWEQQKQREQREQQQL